MKKIITILLSLMMIFSLAGCSDSKKESKTEEDNNVSVNTNDTADIDPAFKAVMSTAAEGEYIVVTVAENAGIEDETAWVGLVPAGTYYSLERDADEVDVYYVYADVREEGKPYVFKCDFSGVDDGTYGLILTSSDDGTTGYVIAQVEVTKKGSDITFNYEKAVVHEAPKPVNSDDNESKDDDVNVPENLEIGVKDLGEDFVLVLKNETSVGEVLVESLYDYDGDKLTNVVFTYHLPDSLSTDELLSYLKTEEIKQDSIRVEGTTVICEMMDEDVKELSEVPRDMLVSMFNSIDK